MKTSGQFQDDVVSGSLEELKLWVLFNFDLFFIDFFLMWTIFKIFIEFITIFLLFHVLILTPALEGEV